MAENKLVNTTCEIDNAKTHQCGYKGCTIKMTVGKRDIGFATTTYSFCMKDDVREYAAQRIDLLMSIARGFTNEQLASMQLKKVDGGK